MTAHTESPNVYQMVLEAMKSAPVDLAGLARRLGVDIAYSQLPDEVSGSIERQGNGTFLIRVNARHPETRQRFTIAHELGHFVSHRHLLGNGTNDNKAYRTMTTEANFNPAIGPQHETDANKFAAGLLMPEPLVREFYKNLGRPQNADNLAAVFKVSPQAMQIRLDGLRRRRAL
ncbi:MAG: ImmA/IrrE family metallo-endopeptidase [Magnetospirillum sp.]|nr:ImmA/IrrE family metallo-endopeptidase [Magnetospirillum sp.]